LIYLRQIRSQPFAFDRDYATVNRMVAGSSPARGASNFRYDA
jgi:hypothetical protein